MSGQNVNLMFVFRELPVTLSIVLTSDRSTFISCLEKKDKDIWEPVSEL